MAEDPNGVNMTLQRRRYTKTWSLLEHRVLCFTPTCLLLVGWPKMVRNYR